MRPFLLFFLLFLLLFSLTACNKNNEQPVEKQIQQETNQQNAQNIKQQIIEQTGALKGVALTPKSFQSKDFTDFLEKSKQFKIISWAGDWSELSSEKSAPYVIAELSKQYDYIPLIEPQFFTQSTGKLVRPLDEETKQLYKTSTLNFIKKYKPKYMGIGIEVNILYEKSPEDFNAFIGLYNEIHKEIKQISPDTKVFTIFQLEKMKGLNGGLFGGKNNESNSEWSLLEKFNSDLMVFTTYPSLIYKTPAEIPADYYKEIKSKTTKPIAFTEIGWPSDSKVQGWESTEQEQIEFTKTFSKLTKNINIEFEIWSFMYDQNTIEPFNTMGLFSQDNKEKLSWNEWISE